jgi:hypothetical protein
MVDLYHVCNDPRLAETNDRVIQLNDSLQKDYQSAIALAEHRHLLTVRLKKYISVIYVCCSFSVDRWCLSNDKLNSILLSLFCGKNST